MNASSFKKVYVNWNITICDSLLKFLTEEISRSITFQFFAGVNTSFCNWKKFHESEEKVNNFLENLSVSNYLFHL